MSADQSELIRPDSVEAVQEVLRDGKRVLPFGGGTKPVLSSARAGYAQLDMSALNGIMEYEPDEMTFTALTGTPVSEIMRTLAKHGQYLPFDPPLARGGATLGGTVAAGISGPGRYQFGGIRDFILGVRYIDSRGQEVRAGGKVVKNAAGFDIPKLMIGSRGVLGVLIDLSFKVFPRPPAYVSYSLQFEDLEGVLDAMGRASDVKLSLSALDIESLDQGYRLWVRLGGMEGTLPSRQARLVDALGASDLLDGEQEVLFWREVLELSWIPTGWNWIVVPITPRRIPEFESSISKLSIKRRYISGGQAVWLACEEEPQSLNDRLIEIGLTGLVLIGPSQYPVIGVREANPFFQRVKSALDPEHSFVEV